MTKMKFEKSQIYQKLLYALTFNRKIAKIKIANMLMEKKSCDRHNNFTKHLFVKYFKTVKNVLLNKNVVMHMVFKN